MLWWCSVFLMLWNHSHKWKQKHTSFWWKPLCTSHKWPHSSMLIVFLCENELFQRGWEVFVILVEIPEGWGGPSVPCKNGKSMEVGGGGVQSEIPLWWGSGYFLELHNGFLKAKSYSFHFHKIDVRWPLSANGLFTVSKATRCLFSIDPCTCLMICCYRWSKR